MDERTIQLFHFEDTNADGVPDAWVNITTTLDLVNDVVCGVATGLSPFAPFEFDNLDPIADCPVINNGNPVQATSSAGAPVTLDASGSSDPDGDPLGFHWFVSDLSVVLNDPDSATPTGTFPIGTTMATVTVTDGRGGLDTCDVVVTVEDTIPPNVTCTTDLAVLWPPNHELRTVTVYIIATDNATNPANINIVSVTVRSNEADNGTGDGDEPLDVDGQDGFTSPVNIQPKFAFDPAANGGQGAWVATIQLRAERAGSGDGRAYIIDAVAQDPAGNSQNTSCCVITPHDRRRRR